MEISKEEMETILAMYGVVYSYGLIRESMINLAERIKKEKGEPIHKQTEGKWLEENAGMGGEL